MQELVESEREYQLCDPGGGVVFSPSFPLHASVLSLKFFIYSAHLQGWIVVCHHTHPDLTVPERCPTGGLLSDVSVGPRGV